MDPVLFTSTEICAAALAADDPYGYAATFSVWVPLEKAPAFQLKLTFPMPEFAMPFPSTQSLDQYALLTYAVTVTVPFTVAPLDG